MPFDSNKEAVGMATGWAKHDQEGRWTFRELQVAPDRGGFSNLLFYLRLQSFRKIMNKSGLISRCESF